MDKFYTKQKVVNVCQRAVAQMPYKYDCIIEPSAGAGAFYDAIQHKNKIGIDILPEHPEIIEKDWFDYTISPSYQSVLVIGNPPFGRYQKLSTKLPGLRSAMTHGQH